MEFVIAAKCYQSAICHILADLKVATSFFYYLSGKINVIKKL